MVLTNYLSPALEKHTLPIMMTCKSKQKMCISLYFKGFMRFCHILALCAFALLCFSQNVIARDLSVEDGRANPEIATGAQISEAVRANDFMIVTANPHATKAGYEILKRGGSAADAAIAAQAVLGLVEPQSSGLGGGAFALYFDAKTQKITTYDGRETAPKGASPFLFYKDGKPMGFKEAVIGGRSVGVPGVPALLEHLHQAHGKLTWMELFEDAICLASNGFKVSARLEKLVQNSTDDLRSMSAARDYFLPDTKAIKAGDILINKPYAKTLKDFSFYGSSVFYLGQIAQNIVESVQNIKGNAGLLNDEDMAIYEVKKRDPVCAPYRAYIVCSMGQPSSGGLTLLQTLGLIGNFNIAAMGNSPEAWNIITQASKLAFADRAKYVADPDFVNTPDIALLDPEYIAKRAELINPQGKLGNIQAGDPPLWQGPFYEEGWNYDLPGTTHISIIDQEGNALSMTSSIEYVFGSHVMVDGFLLNNQLTDFSFSPFESAANQTLVANMVEGGKRPRSSMAPVIVFDQSGAPVLVIGSAGGSRIIGYVLQRIISVIDWGIPIQEAMDAKHILARDNKIEMETGINPGFFQDLDIQTRIVDMNSGLTAVQKKNNHLIGAADPRREGLALGG